MSQRAGRGKVRVLGGGVVVPRLDQELFKWALECESADREGVDGEGRGSGNGKSGTFERTILSN